MLSRCSWDESSIRGRSLLSWSSRWERLGGWSTSAFQEITFSAKGGRCKSRGIIEWGYLSYIEGWIQSENRHWWLGDLVVRSESWCFTIFIVAIAHRDCFHWRDHWTKVKWESDKYDNLWNGWTEKDPNSTCCEEDDEQREELDSMKILFVWRSFL